MQQAHAVVWMHSAPVPAGCGGCLSTDAGPKCRAHVHGQSCAHPNLAGRMDMLHRVLDALDRDVVDPDSGRGIVALQWVKSLRIDHGEAELTVTFAPQCGTGQEMAGEAFDTLRRLLPDTDIYVRHDC